MESKPFQIEPRDVVSFFLAFSRAKIIPFTKSDWDGYCDAIGRAHMVHFLPKDLDWILRRLDILHWTGGLTEIILDDSGLSFIGAHPKGYSAQVNIALVITNYDPGSELDPWYGEDDQLTIETDIHKANLEAFFQVPLREVSPDEKLRYERKSPLDLPQEAVDRDIAALDSKIQEAATSAGLTLAAPTLDDQLRAAANWSPSETGVIPGIPGIAGQDRNLGTASPTATQPPAGPVLDPLESAQNATPAPTAPPANARPMEEAPKDGASVLLLASETEAVAGRWNDTFGRQFWVDEDQQTLGFDDSYVGWVSDTPANRERYGIDE